MLKKRMVANICAQPKILSESMYAITIVNWMAVVDVCGCVYSRCRRWEQKKGKEVVTCLWVKCLTTTKFFPFLSCFWLYYIQFAQSQKLTIVCHIHIAFETTNWHQPDTTDSKTQIFCVVSPGQLMWRSKSMTHLDILQWMYLAIHPYDLRDTWLSINRLHFRIMRSFFCCSLQLLPGNS